MGTVLYDSTGAKLEFADDDIQLKRLNEIASITVDYGRMHDTDFYLVRIPYCTNDGIKFVPKVGITTSNGNIGTDVISALKYAQRENKVFVINGGIYNTSSYVPHGQTIVNGVSLTNLLDKNTFSNPSSVSDTECYPLCIDSSGNLSSPYAQGVDTSKMIADGVVYALTGWGQIIENHAKVDESKFGDLYTDTSKAPRQVIGQYQNGDYFVFTCDGVRGNIANNVGMTYAQVADILIDKGVKYAYVLDGGGSAETVLGNRQINFIYEGTAGRAVPTVIYFDTNE